MLTITQHNFTIFITSLLLFHDCNCAPPDSTLLPIYTPHSKKQQQIAKPSIFLIESIIEFREAYNTWPISKQEFIAKKTKYNFMFTTKITNLIIVNHMATIMAYSKLRKD